MILAIKHCLRSGPYPSANKCVWTDLLTVIVKIWEFIKEIKRKIVKRNSMKALQSWMRQYRNPRSHNTSHRLSMCVSIHWELDSNADQDIHCPDISPHLIHWLRFVKNSGCLTPLPRNHNSCQGRVRVTDTPIRPPIKKLDTSPPSSYHVNVIQEFDKLMLPPQQ